MTVFQPKYWSSLQLDTFDLDGNELIIYPPALPGVEAFKQMEANFSLFFGLAVEIYERTLISDRTPFDRFMEGDDYALSSPAISEGQIFIRTSIRPLLLTASPSATASSAGVPEGSVTRTAPERNRTGGRN